MLSAASHLRWLDRRERRARSRASNGRQVFVMRRRAPLRSLGRGNILHQHFPPVVSFAHEASPWRCRPPCPPRPPARRTARGHGSRRRSRQPRRQREAGQFLSRRMEAWRPRLILFSAQFEFRTATTLLCAAIVSFRSLIPRFIPAISGGTADRNTCWRDSPFELQQNVCISACRAARGRQARFLKRRQLRCGTSFYGEPLPPGRAGLRPLALPTLRRSRSRSAMSGVRRRYETSPHVSNAQTAVSRRPFGERVKSTPAAPSRSPL